MRTMSLLDVSWFPMESEAIPVHGGFMYVFAPPPSAKRGHADRIFNALMKRPVGPPFNLRPRLTLRTMPHWEETGVDLSKHVFRVRLPKPGTDAQLRAAAAKAMTPRLPRHAPLWRFHWFDGLAGGGFAFLITVHHSQWDGLSMFRLMDEVLSQSPGTRAIRAPWEGLSTWQVHEGPREARPKALAGASSLLGDSARAIMDVAKALARHGSDVMTGSVRRPLPFRAPDAAAGRKNDKRRTFGLVRIPLARVKALAQASESTVNDVMSAVADAGYRTYLSDRGVAASRAMVALVPIALKVPGAGNQVSGCMVKLGEPGSTPVERLGEIKAAMTTAKADVAAMGATGAKLFAMLNMGLSATPDLLRIGERVTPTANMFISNPYGLAQPLFLGGSRLDHVFPLIGPSLGVRLGVGFMRYADEIFVALSATRDTVPDIEALAACMGQAFDELELAVAVQATPAPSAVARKAPRKTSPIRPSSSRVRSRRKSAKR